MNQDILENNQTLNEPPRFDAEASANAQPVEPISPARSSLKDKLRSLRNHANSQVRVLVAVVIVGLITGALAGMFLVKVARSEQTTAQFYTEPVEVSATQSTETRTLEVFASELSSEIAKPVQSLSQPSGKYGRARRTINRPRAYRVAVIR